MNEVYVMLEGHNCSRSKEIWSAEMNAGSEQCHGSREWRERVTRLVLGVPYHVQAHCFARRIQGAQLLVAVVAVVLQQHSMVQQQQEKGTAWAGSGGIQARLPEHSPT